MDRSINRKSLAKKTSIINLVARAIIMIIQFATRKMILYYLGVEYLGLNSTLAQLVGTLSVSELGIQAVIIYKLYKPLADDDKPRINEIMSVYRSLYRYVFLFISLGSVVLVPFLKIIITDVEVGFNEIVFAWLLMAITTAVSYLLSYNYALVTADQKLYIITCAESIIRVVFGGLSIYFLYAIHDYFLFLAINMACTIMINVAYLLIRKRYFPWLSMGKPSKKAYKDIFVTVKDGFSGKISSYVFNSTDNIVISSLIGTSLVGIFGNYSTLVASITLIMSSLVNPVQAIIGNFLVKANRKQISEFIINYSYTVYLICSVLFIPTFLLINDFVCLFYGFEFQVDAVVIILLAIDKYISFALISVCSMLDAAGRFKSLKKMYFIGAVLNIVLSVIGVLTIGLPGVLIGTIIGHIFYWCYGGIHCYTEIVKDKSVELKEYIKYNIKLLAVYLCLSLSLAIVFSIFLVEPSIVSFIVKGTLSVLSVLLVQVLVFRNTNEYKYVLDILGINRIIRRIRKTH